MYRNLDVQVGIVLAILSIAWLLIAVGIACVKEYKNNRNN